MTILKLPTFARLVDFGRHSVATAFAAASLSLFLVACPLQAESGGSDTVASLAGNEEPDVSQVLEDKANTEMMKRNNWPVFDLRGRNLTYSLKTSAVGSDALNIDDDGKQIATYQVEELALECYGGVPARCLDFGIASWLKAWVEDGDDLGAWILQGGELGRERVASHPALMLGFQAFLKGCEAGHIFSCGQVANAYHYGSGIQENKATAEGLYLHACENGDADACYGLADLYGFFFGSHDREAKAREGVLLLEKACSVGHQRGCRSLAIKHELGIGTRKDPSKAASIYDQACNNGSLVACQNLGKLHQEGEGVAKDLGKAISLFDQACRDDIGIACHNLALAYADGRGVAQDQRKAASLHARACGKDNEKSCNNLGLMYAQGRGVAKDLDKAALIFDHLCKAGDIDGCSNLELVTTEPKS